VQLSLFSYAPDKFAEIEVSGVGDALAKLPPDTQGWLRIVGHDAAVLAELAEHLRVHPLVLEDMVNIGQRPKVEDHESYLFAVVDVITGGADGVLEEEQVSLLLFERLVVSVQERPSALFRLVEERVRSDRGKMRTMGSDYLAYALIDAAVDHFFPLLERIAARVEEIEDVLLDSPGPETVHTLHQLRRDLLRVRRSTWPLRDMLGSLSRLDSPLVREGTRVWLRDVYDHAVQLIDITESFRETATGMVELYLSSLSNRMNQVMKVLTIISTIFIPLTFLAGIYGMNFNPEAGPLSMPELNWAFGYPVLLTVMAAIGGGMVWMFRRRGVRGGV
jgi:magnesium transporter